MELPIGLIKPILCDTCGNYIEGDRYFVTDIGKAVTHGIGYCSEQCWREKVNEMQRQFPRKMRP